MRRKISALCGQAKGRRRRPGYAADGKPVPRFKSATMSRTLRVEALELRLALSVQAALVDVSAALGLGGLRGGSGEYHAGGLTFTDLTNDGYADLYLIGPSSRGNRLYVNVADGSGGRTFTRVAGDGGTSYTAGDSSGSVAADYDNDGDLDIYLTNFGSGPHDLDGADNILFKNMWMEDHPSGGGDPLSLRFVDVTAATDPTPSDPTGDIQHGLARAEFHNPNPLFTTHILNHTLAAAWADVNRDGWVDIYVGSWDGTNGDPAESHDGFLGERDTLYLNNGDGTFTDVTMSPDGSLPPTPTALLSDGGFELATHNSQASNSAWTVDAPNNTALFWGEAGNTFAASTGLKGVWFRGFAGNPSNPIDASVRQVVVAPDDGDYTLQFDARVEQNLATVAGGLQITISSDGTGGADTTGNLLTLAPDFDFNTYTLTLSGVSAGDQLTIRAEMLDATGGTGPALSGMVDAFRFVDAAGSDGWQQVGGWEYSDGSYNNPAVPAEFSGHNSLQFADFNNDGWQDLIVATMGGAGSSPTRDMLYLNRGVAAAGDWLGYEMVSYDIGFGGSEGSDMGVTVADIDNDGDLDYFSTLLPAAHPLWINNLAETGALTFTRTTVNNDFAWGANFHDFDNNGRVDLLVGTDIGRRSYLHLQDWNGNLSEQGSQSGFTSLYTVRGVAVADYDRDGWSEAAQWSWSGSNPGIQFYQNNSAAENPAFHFLTLELAGDPTLPGQFKSTRDAIGARAYVTADFDGSGVVDADETRLEEVLSGHSQASTTSSLALEFGIGAATSAEVRIVWGSGRETLLHAVAADQFLQVHEQSVDGDFDADGDTDGADFLAWQRGFGLAAHTAHKRDGDGDGDKDVDGHDLEVWAASFGTGEPSPLAAAADSAPGRSKWDWIGKWPSGLLRSRAALKANCLERRSCDWVAGELFRPLLRSAPTLIFRNCRQPWRRPAGSPMTGGRSTQTSWATWLALCSIWKATTRKRATIRSPTWHSPSWISQGSSAVEIEYAAVRGSPTPHRFDRRSPESPNRSPRCCARVSDPAPVRPQVSRITKPGTAAGDLRSAIDEVGRPAPSALGLTSVRPHPGSAASTGCGAGLRPRTGSTAGLPNHQTGHRCGGDLRSTQRGGPETCAERVARSNTGGSGYDPASRAFGRLWTGSASYDEMTSRPCPTGQGRQNDRLVRTPDFMTEPPMENCHACCDAHLVHACACWPPAQDFCLPSTRLAQPRLSR